MDEPATIPMYRAEINSPQDGDILAFRGVGFWSAAIKVRTTGRVSHVGFAYRLDGELWVIEAKEKIGVRLVPLALYLANSAVEVDWHPLLADEHHIRRDLLVTLARADVGKPYASIWQFLRSWGLISRRLADHFGWPADTNEGRFFCSEFVLAKLRGAGYYANGRRIPAQSSPADVLELDCVGKGRRWS